MGLAAPAFLGRVEAELSTALELAPAAPSETRLLAQVAGHLVGANGAKRFRPQLVQLLGSIFSLPDEPLIRIAVAAELIHAASLLHDDVIDAGTERRGQPTANVQWSNSVAVLAGDWLLTRAILAVTPLGLELTRRAIATVEVMTAAAIREVESRAQPALTYPAWRAIAEGKSGELFAWCAGAVAALGHAPAAEPTLLSLGRRLGVAFQMADDLKDLRDPRSGKDRFADLRNRNPSFALVVAMDADPVLRERISQAWRGPQPAEASAVELGQAVLESREMARAQGLLQEEISRSLALLAEVASPAIVQQFLGLASAFASSRSGLLRGAA